MAKIKSFLLPDLGEGLPDAEIVEWHVAIGQAVEVDQPLVSMETAKAVVEVPSPYTGTLRRRYGESGDVIQTGTPLADFELAEGVSQRAEVEPTHHHGPPKPAPPAAAPAAESADAGTVVGAMESSDALRVEPVSEAGGVKAMPAVRALARKLGVDLTQVRPSGAGGVITLKDVREHAATGPAPAGPRTPVAPRSAATVATPAAHAAAALDLAGLSPAQRRAVIAGQPLQASAVAAQTSGVWVAWQRAAERRPLRGLRRNMARVMAASHAAVVPTTLCDDADLHTWSPSEDITVRLIRALVAAAHAVPELNAWFDAERGELAIHGHVHVGIAVDTEDGLLVPVLRHAERLDPASARAALNRIRSQARERSIPAEDLRGATISLSNFGVFAGRYATPVVVPPAVAIVAAGKLRHELVPVLGGVETHRRLPISLSFDHRAATGGEAARFLRALLDDLERPS